MSAEFLSVLLRSPAEAVLLCQRDRDQREIAATCLATITVGGAAFGAAVGSLAGGRQLVYAAVKLPLAVLAVLALAGPLTHALVAVSGRRLPLRAVLAVSLSAGARSALVQLALAPALGAAVAWGIGYHPLKLLASAAYAMAGLSSLRVLALGLGATSGRRGLLFAVVTVFLLAGAQTTWSLRPYLGKPGSEPIPFLTRAREGGLIDALLRSATALRGAPPPGAP